MCEILLSYCCSIVFAFFLLIFFLWDSFSCVKVGKELHTGCCTLRHRYWTVHEEREFHFMHMDIGLRAFSFSFCFLFGIHDCTLDSEQKPAAVFCLSAVSASERLSKSERDVFLFLPLSPVLAMISLVPDCANLFLLSHTQRHFLSLASKFVLKTGTQWEGKSKEREQGERMKRESLLRCLILSFLPFLTLLSLSLLFSSPSVLLFFLCVTVSFPHNSVFSPWQGHRMWVCVWEKQKERTEGTVAAVGSIGQRIPQCYTHSHCQTWEKRSHG